MQWRLGRCLLVDASRNQVLVRGTGIWGCLPDQLTKVFPYRRYPLVDRRNVWQNFSRGGLLSEHVSAEHV